MNKIFPELFLNSNNDLTGSSLTTAQLPELVYENEMVVGRSVVRRRRNQIHELIFSFLFFNN